MTQASELAIVLAYFLLILAIGYYFKDARSGDEYWSAGGEIGTVVNTFAIFAAFASGGTFLGSIGFAYTYGLPFGWTAITGSVVGFIVAAILVAKPMRRVDAHTITDIFDFLYRDWRINVLVPVVVIFAFTLYTVAQLKAAGVVTEYLLDIGYVPSVIGIGLVFIAYVSLGGMWAITITDVLQGVLIWGLMLVMAGLGFAYYDRSISAPASATPGLLEVADMHPASYIGFFVIWLSTVAILPHIVMRVLSADSPRSAKTAYSWVAILYAVFSLIAFYIIPSVALDIDPNLADPDLALIVVMESLLPAIVAGLVAAAILAAVMSTTDALLLAMSASIANDIYGTVLNPDASEASVVRVGSFSTVGMGLVAIGIAALNPPNILVVLYTDATAMMAAAFFFPLVLGIWWKRTTKTGAFAGMVVGLLSYVVFWLLVPLFASILIALPLSLVATVGVSILTEAPSPEEVERLRDALGHEQTGW
ncbi:sodium:solute symporter family protein [Natrinema ejinorense]|uniref:Na+:solute symporter n=1 Tax=Natrinema ejinorense TaxID=373386 RepID=A0A2A5QPR3_9EURY|nr:sodium:solute symporter family protein [Natrinema ejinorense]PCR88814.1 Na+:solute symporter [Natrinema ejinorense]